MRNCMCHDLPVCKTGYGIRVLNADGSIKEYVMTGLTRREAVNRYIDHKGSDTIQLMGHRRVIAQKEI